MSKCKTCGATEQVGRFGTCKHCGGMRITPYTSTNDKYCHDCEQFESWPLNEGQKPLFDGMKPDDAFTLPALVSVQPVHPEAGTDDSGP